LEISKTVFSQIVLEVLPRTVSKGFELRVRVRGDGGHGFDVYLCWKVFRLFIESFFYGKKSFWELTNDFF
jgi:hypothetical protein